MWSFSITASCLVDHWVAGTWVRPLHNLVVKLNAKSLVLSYCNLGLPISSRWWLFCIGMRGLWSVMTWKFCNPIRKVLHLLAAQATANILNSMMAYCDSASLRKCEPAWTSIHWPVGDCCCRINPKSCLLVSVHRRLNRDTLKQVDRYYNI